MKLREFSEKHSMTLLFTNVLFLLTSVALASLMLYRSNFEEPTFRRQGLERPAGMPQRDGTGEQGIYRNRPSGERGVYRNRPSEQSGYMAPSVQTEPSAAVSPEVSP